MRYKTGNRLFTEESLAKRGKSSGSTSRMSAADYLNEMAGESNRSESSIQQNLISTLRDSALKYKGRPLVDYIYAIPNGGFRHKTTASILKGEGVKKGIPDLHLFIAMEPYHSLYIEMKNAKGDLSEDQKAVIPILRAEGHKVVVCRTVNQAIGEIFKYLGWEQ